MGVAHEKFFFYHMPKTAGMFVAKFLLENIPESIDYGFVHAEARYLQIWMLGCFKFGFVRNPFDWYVSWWADKKKRWILKLGCLIQKCPRNGRDQSFGIPVGMVQSMMAI